MSNAATGAGRFVRVLIELDPMVVYRTARRPASTNWAPDALQPPAGGGQLGYLENLLQTYRSAAGSRP